MEDASRKSDATKVHELVDVLTGKRTATKTPTKDAAGDDLDTPEKIEKFWTDFVAPEFAAVDDPRDDAGLPPLPPRKAVDDQPPSLERENEALDDVSDGKATGPDEGLAEACKHSPAHASWGRRRARMPPTQPPPSCPAHCQRRHVRHSTPVADALPRRHSMTSNAGCLVPAHGARRSVCRAAPRRRASGAGVAVALSMPAAV